MWGWARATPVRQGGNEAFTPGSGTEFDRKVRVSASFRSGSGSLGVPLKGTRHVGELLDVA